MTAGHSFRLDLLAPLFTRTVDKAMLISPMTTAPLSLCLCLSRTLSTAPPQSELSGWGDAQETKLFSLMMRYRICHNSSCTGALLKLLKTWHIKSVSEVHFQTDQWDDQIHHTATQACARSRARPCSLQPSESHRDRLEKGWQPPSQLKRGQDRGNTCKGRKVVTD